MLGEEERSPCCGGVITEYDKGNGEKYRACYECYKAVPKKNN